MTGLIIGAVLIALQMIAIVALLIEIDRIRSYGDIELKAPRIGAAERERAG